MICIFPRKVFGAIRLLKGSHFCLDSSLGKEFFMRQYPEE